MQITVHEFTLTTNHTATIKITADRENLLTFPNAVLRELAEAEALELTGFEWDMAAAAPVQGAPAPTMLVKLNKF